MICQFCNRTATQQANYATIPEFYNETPRTSTEYVCDDCAGNIREEVDEQEFLHVQFTPIAPDRLPDLFSLTDLEYMATVYERKIELEHRHLQARLRAVRTRIEQVKTLIDLEDAADAFEETVAESRNGAEITYYSRAAQDARAESIRLRTQMGTTLPA